MQDNFGAKISLTRVNYALQLVGRDGGGDNGMIANYSKEISVWMTL